MYEVRTAELLGTTIRYHQLGRVDGDRPVVLLLHGIGDSSRTWDVVLDRLAARPARERPAVIAVDMLGHGGSSKPRTDYSLGAHANVLRDLFDQLEVTRAVVVGHSLGGGIAMQFLYQYPERVDALVLEAPGGLGPDVFPLLRAATLPGADTVIRILSRTLGMRVLDLAAVVAGRAVQLAHVPVPADSGDVLRIMRPLVDVDARAAFLHTLRSVVDPAGQRVSARSKFMLAGDRPVTLVWGDRDPIIPVRHGREAAELLPSARFELFGGAGHFPHSHDPDRFADLLVEAVRTARSHRGRAQAPSRPRRSSGGGGKTGAARSGTSAGSVASRPGSRGSSTPRSSRADIVTDIP